MLSPSLLSFIITFLGTNNATRPQGINKQHYVVYVDIISFSHIFFFSYFSHFSYFKLSYFPHPKQHNLSWFLTEFHFEHFHPEDRKLCMTVKSSPFPKVPTWWDWSQVELCFSIKIPIVQRIESNLNEEILAPVSSDDDIKLLYHCITNSPSDFITLHCLKTLSHYTRLYHITLPLREVFK